MDSPLKIREGVRQAYSRIAIAPQLDHPFRTGRELAEELGYPSDLLASLPALSVDAFCGVSIVSLVAEIPEGATVLDLGSGAGMDTIIVSRRTGEKGKVIAVDFSETMLQRACEALKEGNAVNVETRLADAEALPLEDQSIDVVVVNGIFNLNPNREAIFLELARVVKPGGAVYAAEPVLLAELSEEILKEGNCSLNEANWFS